MPTSSSLNGPPYYFQPHAGRLRQSSSAYDLAHYPPPSSSRSPISAGSSTIHLPQWPYTTHDASYPYLSTSSSQDSLDPSFGFYNSTSSGPQPIPRTALHRDMTERRDLMVPTGMPEAANRSLGFDEMTCTNEERYLNAYWHYIHPHYAFIYRPSFSLYNAPPLLKAAMLALGAHSLEDASDKTNARVIHERCLKALKTVRRSI